MTAGVLRAIFPPVSEGLGVTEETTEKFQAIDRAEYHSALAAGLMIGRYRIMSVLGEGGFGITYLCSDTQLHRACHQGNLPSGLAIRQGGTEVLPRSTEASKDFVWGRSRFLDEARTMAKLSRVPAVVRVHDFLEAHGTAYVVMELLAGETLAQRLAREGTLGQADIERILPATARRPRADPRGRLSSPRRQARQRHAGARRRADPDRFRCLARRRGRAFPAHDRSLHAGLRRAGTVELG